MSNKVNVVAGPNGQRIFLGNEFPGVYFTAREAEMALLLSQYKYREIGKILDISRRTAEYYSMNMKKKLHCINKRELVLRLQKSGILNELKDLIDIRHFSSKPCFKS